jgi:hypothetical protein
VSGDARPVRVLHAVASDAVEPLVRGTRRPARVVAVRDHALYLDVDGTGLTVETADGIGLPNGLAVTEPAAERPFRTASARSPASVGDHRVVVGDLEVVVRRWRRARPTLRRCSVARLRSFATTAHAHVAAVADPLPSDLADALDGFLRRLAAGDVGGAVDAARDGLLGRGPGLTPTGDDLLAGVIAAVRSFGPRLAPATDGAIVATVSDVADRVARIAGEATTDVSGALLVHAARGEVAIPVGDLLRAVAGDVPVLPALDRLLAVGGSSGRDLACGVVAGVELLLGCLPARPMEDV